MLSFDQIVAISWPHQEIKTGKINQIGRIVDFGPVSQHFLEAQVIDNLLVDGSENREEFLSFLWNLMYPTEINQILLGIIFDLYLQALLLP